METITNVMSGQRPERIPDARKWQVWRVVKSSRQILSTDKPIYQEIMVMDRSNDGCFLGTQGLADRCGLSPRQVKDGRHRLKQAGLLGWRERPGYRSNVWFALFPLTVPSASPSVEEVAELAAALDFMLKPVSGDGSGTLERTSTKDIGTFERTTNTPSGTLERTCHIKSTEPRTEQSTEPTEGIQEEEVGREEKKRPDFATWESDWRDGLGRKPTKYEIERYAPAGTEA